MKSNSYSLFISLFLTLLISTGVCIAADKSIQPVCEAYELRRQYSTITVSSMLFNELRLVEAALIESGFTVTSVRRTFPDKVLITFGREDIDVELKYEKGDDRNIYNVRFDFTTSKRRSVSDLLANATELVLRELKKRVPEGKTRLNMYTQSKCVKLTFPKPR